MNGLALYELVGQWKRLEALADGDELPAEVIRDTLDGLTGEIEEKATNVQLFIENLLVAAESIENRAAEMSIRAKRLEKRAESLRQYMLLNLQVCGVTKIDSPWFTIRVQDSPPRVVIDAETQIPAEYWKQPPLPPQVIDRAAIAEDIKAGKEVPGAHSERGQHVVVKVK